jgi:hypothetical protein
VLPGVESLRSLPDFEPYRDAWIVLRTDINRPRKRYDLAIQAFCQFSAGKPVAGEPGAPLLWLHCAAEGDDLPIIDWYDRCLAESGQNPRDRPLLLKAGSDEHPDQHPYSSEAFMARLYMTANCYLQTSDAEGWGLGTVEASQHGAIAIVGNHSAHKDIWPGAAVMVEPVSTKSLSFALLKIQGGKLLHGRHAVRYPVQTAEQYAEALEVAYRGGVAIA